MVTRRGFLQAMVSAAAAAAVFDPERLLWVPGAKTFMDTHVHVPTFAIGDLVYIKSGAPLPNVAAMIGRPMGRLASMSQLAYFNQYGVAQLEKVPEGRHNPVIGTYMGRSGEMSIIQIAGGEARIR